MTFDRFLAWTAFAGALATAILLLRATEHGHAV